MSDTTPANDDPQEDTGGIDSVEDSDFWDDDDGWTDRPARRGAGGAPPVWIIAVVVLVLVVIGALVFKGGDDDDGGTTTDAGTDQQSTAPGDTAGEEMCATWPGIGGLGRPEIVETPGIHVWSDLEGWHVNRVPGPGVPAATTVVTNNDVDHPPTPKEGATGGATAVAEGATVKLTLPEGAEAAEASFEPGPYSTAVVIIMNDALGAPLPTTAYTVGGGENPPVNPITATQVMQPCGT